MLVPRKDKAALTVLKRVGINKAEGTRALDIMVADRKSMVNQQSYEVSIAFFAFSSNA